MPFVAFPSTSWLPPSSSSWRQDPPANSTKELFKTTSDGSRNITHLPHLQSSRSSWASWEAWVYHLFQSWISMQDVVLSQSNSLPCLPDIFKKFSAKYKWGFLPLHPLLYKKKNFSLHLTIINLPISASPTCFDLSQLTKAHWRWALFPGNWYTLFKYITLKAARVPCIEIWNVKNCFQRPHFVLQWSRLHVANFTAAQMISVSMPWGRAIGQIKYIIHLCWQTPNDGNVGPSPWTRQ